MGKTNTKKLVQGAMLAALFGVLSLLNTYTGSMFDVLICYGMVIPLVWYGYTYTMKDNMIVCFVSMIVIAMVGLPFFIISAFSSCASGIFIAEALKRKAKKETILVGTLIISFLNNILLYEIFAGLVGMDLMAELKESYEMIVSVFPSFSQMISLRFVLSLAPLFLLMVSTMEMYVIVLLCQIGLYRFGIRFPGSFHIASLHLSKKTGIVLAMTLFGSYILKEFVHVDYIAVDYVYIVSYVVLLIQGLACVCFCLIAERKPKLMILAMLGIFIPRLNVLYIVAGFFDIFSDLRENLLYNKHKLS